VSRNFFVREVNTAMATVKFALGGINGAAQQTKCIPLATFLCYSLVPFNYLYHFVRSETHSILIKYTRKKIIFIVYNWYY